MNTKLKAEEIYEYMVERLAEGIYISPDDEKEIIAGIENLIGE